MHCNGGLSGLGLILGYIHCGELDNIPDQNTYLNTLFYRGLKSLLEKN